MHFLTSLNENLVKQDSSSNQNFQFIQLTLVFDIELFMIKPQAGDCRDEFELTVSCRLKPCFCNLLFFLDLNLIEIGSRFLLSENHANQSSVANCFS